jgi:hypothetical protein
MTAIRNLITASLLVGATAFVAPACAFSLLGDTITSSGYAVNAGSATIGAGVEFIGIHSYLDFDFGANTLTISSNRYLTNWSGFQTNTFSGFDQAITSFSLISNNGFSADFLTGYSFTSNTITLNMNNGFVPGGNGSTAVFAINEVAPIPEPETYAMMLAGLGMVGLAARRRKLRASA